jgi:hypothetical protein
MSMKTLIAAGVLTALASSAALAQNTYQNTCSNIAFAYSGNDASIHAMCLRANGTPNQTQLLLQGISNQNGKLTQGTGPSTFQQSCGNIQVIVNGPNSLLSALCRTTSGSSLATSLSLNNISNNNGNLAQ